MYSDVRAINELVRARERVRRRILSRDRQGHRRPEHMVERMLIGLLTGGHVLLEGVPGLAKTLTVRTLCDAIQREVLAHPVHARPAAGRPDRHRHLQPAERASSPPSSARSSRTWCSPTRSTARRPRCRARCSRRCRSGRSRSATRPIPLPARSWSWRRRTRSSRRAPTRCPRRRSTASCCMCRSATRRATKSARSWSA